MKVITIGRNKENNDIVVNDNKVSRNHLQMVMDDQGNFSVVDLNSTNGTFINGQRITGEVPLKVSDELRIGDTVLPWQSYFNDRPNIGIGTPVSPRTSSSHIPVSHHQHSSDSSPKHWLKYVVIGVIVLFIVGGGVVGWKIHHDKQQKEAIIKKQQEEEAKEKEADKAAEDNANKEDTQSSLRAAKADAKDGWDKYYSADAEAKKWEDIAHNSQSEKDKEIARLKRENAEELREAAKKAQDELDALNKKYQLEIQNKDEEISKAKTDQKATKRALELNDKMQKILNHWNDNQAHNFCEKELKLKIDKDQARNNVTKWFSEPNNNAEKEKKIKKMDEWSRKNNIKNYKSIQ